MRAIGLMSGTSLDGVDVAVLESDGERITAFGPAGYRAYTADERSLLKTALVDAADMDNRMARPGVLAAAEAVVDRAHAEAIGTLVRQHGLLARDVDVVGYHGQTVLHRPARGLTVQIGNGQRLANAVGMPVVFDFRAADMAAGGQGAPLVPVFHRALAEHRGLDRPLAVLNLGGVGNVTWIGRDGELLAFDTGPGNALLDDLMRQRNGTSCDHDGAGARAGKVDHVVLRVLLDDPYFSALPPKSLDRNHFHAALSAVAMLSVEDAAATLTAFTAGAVLRAREHMPETPKCWIVAGGGARNPAMLDALRGVLPEPVRTADELGWQGDSIEAQAFAFLAVRSLRGLPLTFPGTTGVSAPVPGGAIVQPAGDKRCAHG
jgi:anhydro-N-acetylmuramic acid kinase